MLMVTGIDHINICVTDIEAAKAFFVLLGFDVERERLLEGEWIEKVVGLADVRASYVCLRLPGAATRLELLQYITPAGGIDPGIASPNQVGIRHLAFQVSDINEAYLTLKKNGINFFSEVQTNAYGKQMCYFYGPDNIILELAEF